MMVSDIASRIPAIKLIAFDFDGVFTDNAVWISEAGLESVRCWRSDGLGIKKLAQLGIHHIIISTETNPVVSLRAKKMGIPCLQSVSDKRAALEKIAFDKKIPMSCVAFMGNDINDLDCLESVGLPIIVNDAHQSLLKKGFYRTQAAGGYGAVREICDLIEEVLHHESVQPGE